MVKKNTERPLSPEEVALATEDFVAWVKDRAKPHELPMVLSWLDAMRTKVTAAVLRQHMGGRSGKRSRNETA